MWLKMPPIMAHKLTSDCPAITILNMNFLEGLNPQQQQAVQAIEGPVLVLAGPGSGKTRVLTHRIAYLVGAIGVRPNHILAVTFTNKAAREMSSRVEMLLGSAARGITLGTFHATCAKILRREANYLPFDANFVIYDADDQRSLTKQVIRELDLDDKHYPPGSIHAVISRAKNELIFPDDFPVSTYRDEVVKRVYLRYQQLLQANNALDFDDLLMWMAFLLEEQPEVKQRYARRFEHILVDEFQDTNMAQYTLLTHLASFHRNIFVVGDIDQSIYRWRGADYRNVMRFESQFPDAQVIVLEENYRSTQFILDAAMAVINATPRHRAKNLFTRRGEGKKIILRELYDDREEAAFVVNTIAQLVASGEAQPGDFAIMYRVNAQSRILEEAFLAAGLPYRLVGAQRFYGRREVKDMIAYLRLIRNPNDEISLYRVINTPARGIGNKTLARLKTYAQQQQLSLGDVLLDLGENPASAHGEAFPSRATEVLKAFGSLLYKWHNIRDAVSPLDLLDAIIADTGYQSYINDGTEEGIERWENVLELRRLASEYRERGLDVFLEDIALVSDQDTIEEDANVPTLLTLHTAKGLEFPVVIIVGLNEGTLPHSRSLDDEEELEEERRLLYVGITRAKDRLYLLYSLNNNRFGFSEPAVPSRFLNDIPLSLLDTQESLFVRQRGEGRRAQRWEAARQTPDTTLQPRYSPGMRVHHAQWGEGLVLNSRILDGDEILDIFFDRVGLKKVSASVAKLDILT